MNAKKSTTPGANILFETARADVSAQAARYRGSDRVVAITELAIRANRVENFTRAAERLKQDVAGVRDLNNILHTPAPEAPSGASVTYFIYEHWRTAAGLRHHWQSIQLRNFYRDIRPWLAAPPKFRILREQEHNMATRVLRTGATKSWDTEGFEVPNDARGGQDGALQKGLAPSGARFQANGDGSVTDTVTGLTWLEDADAFGEVEWEQALSIARDLSDGSHAGLSDKSKPGDWRLANIRELLSLLDYNEASPILPSGHPFRNVKTAIYWTSTTLIAAPRLAWMMTLGIGPTVFVLKETKARMWPVRGESRVVLQTGQHEAWNRAGDLLSSTKGTGQDGDLRAGVPLPVASRRFEAKNGAVLDHLTGLVWLQNGDAFGFQTWSHALRICNTLKSGMAGLGDGSEPGQWRLPNIREIESLVDYGKRPEQGALEGFPGCVPYGHPFRNVRPSSYWTSTTVASGPAQAMFIILGVGPSIFEDKDHRFFVWPVRDPVSSKGAGF